MRLFGGGVGGGGVADRGGQLTSWDHESDVTHEINPLQTVYPVLKYFIIISRELSCVAPEKIQRGGANQGVLLLFSDHYII